MNRVKNFNATGVAPNGRLYAGDLNAIQDAAMAQTDLSQTVALAAVQIGETGLQLLRYGSLEARITGALRTDGILRGLGGVFAGTYTTVQRNAIPLGSRPYGLVIWNTDNNRLENNIGTDAVPNWQPVGVQLGFGAGLALGQAQIASFLTSGIYTARPGAGTLPAGSIFYATDTLGVWKTDGAATWTLVNQGSPRVSLATFGSGPWTSVPYDGMRVTLLVDSANGINWDLMFNAGSGSTYRWEVVGGRPLVSIIDANENTSSLTFTTLTTPGPSITVPRAGDYDVQIGFESITPAMGIMSYDIGGTAASEADRAFRGNIGTASPDQGMPGISVRRKTGLAASTALTAKYHTNGVSQGNATFDHRYMYVMPVRIS
jgi:hypothetical protein